ncbi:MAG TPA: YceI family protein [Ohtaekwangia sp.]|nr:YceI family protein [Ohtaekwangia sp.]
MKKTVLLSAVVLLASAFSAKSPSNVTYKVDVEKSTILWAGYALFSFNEHSGNLKMDNGEIRAENGLITAGNFKIDMTSLKNLDMKGGDGAAMIEDHLKGDDFFAVAKYPKAHFEIIKSEMIKDAQPGNPNMEITGMLTIKDVKNQVTFPATVSVTDASLTAHARFKFDRTKWNVKYNSGRFFDIGDNAISDAVGIELNIIASNNNP